MCVEVLLEALEDQVAGQARNHPATEYLGQRRDLRVLGAPKQNPTQFFCFCFQSASNREERKRKSEKKEKKRMKEKEKKRKSERE